MDSLARAIIYGRWAKLDFKKLASEEAHGKWLGSTTSDGQPEWNSQMGLWSAIWNPLVYVYTSANRWDLSAQRVLTIISTEAMQGIRAGLPIGVAINDFVVRVFAVLEDEYRRMQRGLGTLPSLERVWASVLMKPFYRQFTVVVATKRAAPAASIGNKSDVERLLKRVAQLEAQRGGPALKPPGESGDPKSAKQAYIPEEKVRAWKAANPGKCFRFHLKGSCPSAAGECKLGSH